MPPTLASDIVLDDPLDAADAHADLAAFDDQELERAPKAVAWNPRDVLQFLRNARAG